MVTGNIKAYVAGVVAVLLLLILIPTAIHNYSLQLNVIELEAEKTKMFSDAIVKKMELAGLRDAIAEQNKHINELEAQTARMRAEGEKAKQEAAGRVLMLNNRIAWLEKDKGASCNAAGIGKTILDEVLP
jgi:hypothetical protein